MNTPDQQLSESLLAACKAAGIEELRYIAQDEDGLIYHFDEKPYTYNESWLWIGDTKYRIIHHPPYAADWQDSLMEWVEPQGGMATYKSPEEWTSAHKGEPLANVLALHPDHVADVSKMIPSGIEALVCTDIAKRQQVGIAKYGTTVVDNPLAHMQWLQHAYEECLDMAVYLKRAMAEKGARSYEC